RGIQRQQVLTASRIGVEAYDRVVSEPGREHERIVARATIHGVVAGTTSDRVIASAAGQRIVAGAADDRVVEPVAGAVEVASADEGQVVDIVAQRVGGGRRQHRVDAGARGLCNDVARVVDAIGVVPRAADHRVDAGSAIDRIIAGTTGDRVVERVAGADEVAGAGEGQILNVGPQRVAVERRLYRVGAFTN